MSACGIQRAPPPPPPPRSRKWNFCLSRHRLIDANASEFSPLQCHEMKISQPGEQINSELCHAIFVGHYMRFLFIPETVPQKCSELRRHRGSILPVVLEKKNKRKRFGAAGVFLLWPVAKEVLTSFKRAPGESCPLIAPRCWITAASHRHSGWKLQLNALNLM